MANDKTNTGWTVFGSVGAALAAAACCLGPFVLVSVGVGGAWIGNLSAIEPYRPLLMVASAGLLGLGFYRVYGGASAGECEEDEACDVPRASLANRVSLWIGAIVVAALFASPYLLQVGVESAVASSEAAPGASAVAAEDGSGTTEGESELRTVTLEVEGMTCGGCVKTLSAALEKLDGVEQVNVTLEPPRATVTYDPEVSSIEELTKATADAGFPSEPTD